MTWDGNLAGTLPMPPKICQANSNPAGHPRRGFLLVGYPIDQNALPMHAPAVRRPIALKTRRQFPMLNFGNRGS